MMTILRRAALACCALSAAALPSGAQELTIAFKAAIDSADPHLLFTPNRNVQLHVYEPLVAQDAQVQPRPGLAESWRVVDPTTWEFVLRRDAVFHDGTPLTAEDAVFSIRRAMTIEGLRTYRPYLKDVAGVEAVDAHTIRIRTHTPTPLLPFNLTTFPIASARAAQGATAEDFNGGRAAIGTGPYRWVRWTGGQDVVLERNPAYRGGVEPWSKVTFRFIPNDSARTAALLAGDVDVADAIPAGLYARVRGHERTRLQTTPTLFMIHFVLDRRAQSPFITGADGKPLAQNPLNDARVRRAMTHAINRQGIAERAMEGGAEPAGQFMPPGFHGHDPALVPAAYDAALSRRLLGEAGYPQGFNLTIHCMNDRFSGDARTCQTVGQMFTAIGIRTQVETMPSSVYFRRARGAEGMSEFSTYMIGFGSAAGLATNALSNMIETQDRARGRGMSNNVGYSNPEFDRVLHEAEATFDEARRDALIRQATRIAMEDQAVLPVFFVNAAWGLRRNLAIEARGDGYTMATTVRAAR